MQVIYHQTVIDRTGVDEANNEDRMTARSIIAEMEQVGEERIGYDADGKWHVPGGIQRASEAAENIPLRVRLANETYLALAIMLSCVVWAVVIWAIVHFAQKAGLPW
jgi:hypothetical protein